jgi:predicted RNase H-like nuclease (RuvC/YqgF family)
MSTAEQRQEWARLAEAATPGEWEHESASCVIWDSEGEEVGQIWSRDNMAFVIVARAAVPALLADVDRLTGDNAALSEALDTALLHLKESEAERDALAGQLRQLRYDYDQDLSAARKYSAEDRVFAADELAQVKRERDALAAELASYKRNANYIAGIIESEGVYRP